MAHHPMVERKHYDAKQGDPPHVVRAKRFLAACADAHPIERAAGVDRFVCAAQLRAMNAAHVDAPIEHIARRELQR